MHTAGNRYPMNRAGQMARHDKVKAGQGREYQGAHESAKQTLIKKKTHRGLDAKFPRSNQTRGRARDQIGGHYCRGGRGPGPNRRSTILTGTTTVG